ncbi:MAG: hypothetical protein QM496_00645 [Verrucomicrobiota bacterium]
MQQLIRMKSFYARASFFMKQRGIQYVLVFPFAVSVLLTSGCYDSYGVAELKLEQEDHKGAIERAKASIESVSKEIDEMKSQVSEAEELKASLKRVVDDNRIFQKEIETYEVELRGTMAVLKACQDAFKIKVNIEKGKKFKSIRLKNGKTITNAAYKGFGGKGLSFSHSGGVGVFALEQMPEEIGKHFILPPPKPIEAVDPKSILARKPDALKTYAQIQKEKDLKLDAEYDAVVLKQKMSDEQREREKAKRIAEMNEKRKRVEALRAELTRHESAYNQHLNTVREQKYAWDTMNLPPAKADRQKIITGFAKKGRTLSLKIDELEEKLEAAQQ